MICESHLSQELFQRARKITTILFDVDGVFANGQIVYDINKIETKYYDAHDGFGIKLARFAGFRTGIISARESDAIRHRAKELKIDTLYLGRYDKLNAYRSLKSSLELSDQEIAFAGDDIADIPVLKQVGLPIAVTNAAREVKAAARFMTRRRGGHGAIREVIEFILYAQGRLDETLAEIETAL